jgi:hypothetical protein
MVRQQPSYVWGLCAHTVLRAVPVTLPPPHTCLTDEESGVFHFPGVTQLVWQSLCPNLHGETQRPPVVGRRVAWRVPRSTSKWRQITVTCGELSCFGGCLGLQIPMEITIFFANVCKCPVSCRICHMFTTVMQRIGFCHEEQNRV